MVRRPAAASYAAAVRDVVLSGCGVAGMAFLLYRVLAPFGRIWRGDASAARLLPTSQGSVEARNYLAYLAWIVPGIGGFLLLFLAWLTASLVNRSTGHVPSIGRGVVTFGFLLLLAACPLTVLHIIVNAINRPRILVPPPYRHQLGAIASWRRRRRRRQAGLPPTDHLVQIIEVPDDDSGQPWLMACCTAAECDWTAEVDPGLGAVDAEDELRQKAHKHSSRVQQQTVRPPI